MVQLTAHSAFKSGNNFLETSFEIFLELAAEFAKGRELSHQVSVALGY